ncbi:MAG: ChuX/HutX family heme-like substrate-binding protein [Bacteroidota bacterium]
MLTIKELRSQRDAIKATEPQLRQRQLAERLGISEFELLTLSAGEHVIRLAGDWKELLKELKEMGYVMALTRNENCVHERKGVYDNITFYAGAHNMGVAVNPDIDLRFFMNEWKYALAVVMHRAKGKSLYSFQFFNARGEAVHKVFSTPKSDLVAYHQLLEKYRGPQEPILLEVTEKPAPKPEVADESVDVASFQTEWRELKDTHHFFGMLRKYELSRTQALRLAPEGMVTPVDRLAVEQVLTSAAVDEVSIMCFVHSPGCIQIHSGPVKRLLWHGDWYNVMDPAFNLHLNTKAIDACYVVRKPTDDGIVTSLELFDAEGQLIVYFFGARKPGKPELSGWTNILNQLPSLSPQLQA